MEAGVVADVVETTGAGELGQQQGDDVAEGRKGAGLFIHAMCGGQPGHQGSGD